MARIRTTKPEFWTSESLAECTIPARLLFIGFWNFCDDRGVHPASSKRLRMEVFPNGDLTADEVQACVDELIAVGCLSLFEVDGKRYWHVVTWDENQKIQKPTYKFPTPPIPSPKNPDRSPPEGNGREGIQKGRERKEEPTNVGSCSEPPPAAASEPAEVLEFPTVGKGAKTWGLTQAKVDEYAEAFPGLDVMAECRLARQWCRDNPKKRKTPKGMPAFLTRWLTNQQNQPRGSPPTTAAAQDPNRFNLAE